MIRNIVSFLIVVISFIALLYIANYASDFISDSKEVERTLMIFRLLTEGALIGAPLFFLRKLKNEKLGEIKKKEKIKAIKITVLLLIFVLIIEFLLASM